MIRSRFLSRDDALAWVLRKYRMDYDAATNTLLPRSNTGFFSNCAFTLATLTHLAHLGIFPRGLDFTRGFGNYKDDDTGFDLYPRLFKSDPLMIESIRSTWAPHHDLRCADHHTVYAVLPYHEISTFIRAYFQPSDAIRELVLDISRKYSIDPARTVAVCYRGTDKSIEVRVARPEAFVRATLPLLEPDTRVLVQTDQTQAKDLFLSEIPNAFALDEMPTTTSTTVLHKLGATDLRMTKNAFVMNLVAVTVLLSSCRAVVNHTGNMALWIALFRGNAHGMVQFDRHGRLVTRRTIAAGHVKNLLRRARRWARKDIAYYT